MKEDAKKETDDTAPRALVIVKMMVYYLFDEHAEHQLPPVYTKVSMIIDDISRSRIVNYRRPRYIFNEVTGSKYRKVTFDSTSL